MNKNLDEIIRRCLSETITEFLEQPSFAELSKINHGEPINSGELKWLTDEEFKNYATEIWDIFQLSYQNIGGLKSYRNFQDFLNKRHTAKVIFGNNGSILACATYRRMDDSLKMTAIGCNQTCDGKSAIQQHVQDDIINYQLMCWAEVSGAIEYFFNKYNGFPMPNFMAANILGINPKLITLSNNDDVHYERPIGPYGEKFTKMIFGFKSEEAYNEILKKIDDYEGFMNEINSIKEDSHNFKYTINQCYFIIDNIYRLHEEDNFNELLPSWFDALNECLSILKSVSIDNRTKSIDDYIYYTEYLLKDMTVLELNKSPL